MSLENSKLPKRQVYGSRLEFSGRDAIESLMVKDDFKSKMMGEWIDKIESNPNQTCYLCFSTEDGIHALPIPKESMKQRLELLYQIMNFAKCFSLEARTAEELSEQQSDSEVYIISIHQLLLYVKIASPMVGSDRYFIDEMLSIAEYYGD